MRKITYITCPICSKEFQSLGYARHRAMHRDQAKRMEKILNKNSEPAGQ